MPTVSTVTLNNGVVMPVLGLGVFQTPAEETRTAVQAALEAGYRHIGRCDRLESLGLMYCRQTGDAATAAIRSLPRLRTYFASDTRITDETPRLLGESGTLEEVTFGSCRGLTTDGIAALAAAPRLRRLDVAGMPRGEPEVVTRFPASVRVRYRA